MTIDRLRQIVEDNDTHGGRIFDLVSQSLVILSLIAFTLDTSRTLPIGVKRALDWGELIIVVLFTAEYLMRIFVAQKKLGFILSFFGIVDLIAILPFYLSMGIDLRSIRILRIVRVLRVFKLARYSDALEHIRDALVLVRSELSIFVFATILMLYVSAVGIYYCENTAQPDQFSSILSSLWWSVITLTTVGYGDMFPVTVGGKFFTSVISLIGVGIVAIPTGRLLCIAGDFTKYDQHAVEQIARNIELIRYKKYGEDLLLFELVNAAHVSNAVEVLDTSIGETQQKRSTADFLHYKEQASRTLVDIYEAMRSFVLALGDDVIEKQLKFYVAFRRMKNFVCAEIRPQSEFLLLYLKVDPDAVDIQEGFIRDMRTIGHFGTGDLEVSIRTMEDLERAKPLIIKSYEDS